MGVVLGLFVLISSCTCATYFATSAGFSGAAYPWLFVAAPLLVAVAVAFAQRRLREELFERLRGQELDITKGFFVALSLYGATYAFSTLVCAPGSERSIWLISLYGQLGDPKTLHSHEVLVPVGIFTLALLEELVWRGVVTVGLEQYVGSRFAWVVSAVLYASIQLPSLVTLRLTSMNPLLVLAALGLGLVFGGIAKATGRLRLGIFAHALYVWAVVASFPLWTLQGKS